MIATDIQEIYNPFQIAQVFQPVDLQKLFNNMQTQQSLAGQMMSQLSPIQSAPPQQQQQPIQPPMQTPLMQPQQPIQPIQMNGDLGLTNGGVLNPMLNGTTIVTSSNMNVTYLNASTVPKHDNPDKFKMHQGFIAVLKVR